MLERALRTPDNKRMLICSVLWCAVTSHYFPISICCYCYWCSYNVAAVFAVLVWPLLLYLDAVFLFFMAKYYKEVVRDTASTFFRKLTCCRNRTFHHRRNTLRLEFLLFNDSLLTINHFQHIITKILGLSEDYESEDSVGNTFLFVLSC